MLRRKTLFPAVILLLGGLTSAWLVQGKPLQPRPALEPELPVIRVLEARPETVELQVRSQGTVEPRTSSVLVAQVPGRVIEVGPGLEPGAFFEAGDVLLRLDPSEQELVRRRAEAGLERARAEEEYAEAMLRRRQRLGRSGVASAAAIDEAMRAARTAKARRMEAEVDLVRAETDLDRTIVRAPFDGRTLDRSIGRGRYAAIGTAIAEIYAVDYAEVRLPVPDAELAFLNLSLGSEVETDASPKVVLEAYFAGETHRWLGRIVRTEAQIDPRTRMVHVVARVPRPYDPNPDAPRRPPLAAGLFVEAEIEGRRIDEVVRVPRESLEDGHLFVVDERDRLERRRVDVLRVERSEALVVGGLEARERISLLETRLAREGLVVRTIEQGTLAVGGLAPRPTS